MKKQNICAMMVRERLIFFYAKCSVQSRRQVQPANVVSMKNRTENKGVSSLKLQFDLLLHRPIYIYDQDNF